MTDPASDRPRPPHPVPRPGDPRPPAQHPTQVRPEDPRPVAQQPLGEVGASVATAMAELDAAAARPVAEHVAAFERVHAVLGDALADGRPDQAAGQG